MKKLNRLKYKLIKLTGKLSNNYSSFYKAFKSIKKKVGRFFCVNLSFLKKQILALLIGIFFSLWFIGISNTFAAQINKVLIPKNKVYILPVHKYIYINTLTIAKYNRISRSFLETRYPKLSNWLINDLKNAQRHPSLWMRGTLINLSKNEKLEVNLLQVMTRSKTFPETAELKYDAKNTPWFIQKIRNFQLLMTNEAVSSSNLKLGEIFPYPQNLHNELNDKKWNEGFRGQGLIEPISRGRSKTQTIEDETSIEPHTTPHLANILISNDVNEMTSDLKENGIVLVKNDFDDDFIL